MRKIQLKSLKTSNLLSTNELKSIVGGSRTLYECLSGKKCSGTYFDNPYSGRCSSRYFGLGQIRCGCIAQISGHGDVFLEQEEYLGENTCMLSSNTFVD